MKAYLVKSKMPWASAIVLQPFSTELVKNPFFEYTLIDYTVLAQHTSFIPSPDPTK